MTLIVFDIRPKNKQNEWRYLVIDDDMKDKVIDRIKSANKLFNEKHHLTDPVKSVEYILQVIYEDFGYTTGTEPADIDDTIVIEVTE